MNWIDCSDRMDQYVIKKDEFLGRDGGPFLRSDARFPLRIA